MLCVVSREAILAKKRVSKKRKKAAEAFFKDCLGLNSPKSAYRRTRAMDRWRRKPRSRLKRAIHFSDFNDLRAENRKAQALMNRMFFERI
jgi:hypothetical protein